MDPETVLDLWFGPDGDDAEVAGRQAALWWGHDPETDAELRRRFEQAVDDAAFHRLDHWAETARGRLALVILLDQMPRAIWRGRRRAFSCDARALRLSLEGLEQGADRELRPVERVFLYLPLEHAEDLELQERCVGLFERLAAEVSEAHRETFAGFLDYAVRHRDIVARFGRFPHRNTVLGRESTAEERQFLTEPGSSF